MMFRRGCAWGVKQQAWEAIVIRAVRESVKSSRRGTRDVPNKSSVEKIRCRVNWVGALRDLGIRNVMERL